jgi:Family of unknown function (DUF5681)
MSRGPGGRDKRPKGRPTAPYEVGYGQPPMHSRFKSGQSGNPKGRPKGSRNRPPEPSQEDLRAIIRAEAYRDVPVNDANGTVTIPMAQAVMRSLAVCAAKGNTRAQRLFTELLNTVEREELSERAAALGAAMDYKITWERELQRRKKLGLKLPDPLPHPDHIVIDPHAGTVRIKGPATKEEKAAWARWEKYRDLFAEELKELKALWDDPDCPNRDEIEGEIAQAESVLKITRAALDGYREAMRFLEGLDLPEADV